MDAEVLEACARSHILGGGRVPARGLSLGQGLGWGRVKLGVSCRARLGFRASLAFRVSRGMLRCCKRVPGATYFVEAACLREG